MSVIPNTVLKEATSCAIEAQELKVIQDADSWKALWTEMNSIVMPQPALPEVDFNQKMVVAYFLGTQNYGGHSVKIKQLYMLGDVLQVDVVHTAPGKNCFTTSALTQPHVIVTIDKTAFESTKANLSEVVNDC